MKMGKTETVFLHECRKTNPFKTVTTLMFWGHCFEEKAFGASSPPPDVCE